MNRKSKTILIAGKPIGFGSPCFVIAEAGVNHNGDVKLALDLIDAAKLAGADAVKFQTFSADRLVTRDAPKADYQKRATGTDETQHQMLKRLELSEAQHKTLMARCDEREILFMSTPFDEQSADMLDRLDMSVFKLPSGEITNLAFISHVAAKKKPVIFSTGMSTLDEVKAAANALKEHLFVALHCVSNYPASPVDANLRAMKTMADALGAPVGYSDHTPGINVALAAVALGACVLEKHLTLDKSLPGPDHQASLEPDEFSALVRGIREVEASLGHGRKEPAASEEKTKAVARKSLVAVKRIPKGAALQPDAVAIRRPGTGLPPSDLSKIIGKKANRDVADGTLLTKDMFS